jgi:hypothetical protein
MYQLQRIFGDLYLRIYLIQTIRSSDIHIYEYQDIRSSDIRSLEYP